MSDRFESLAKIGNVHMPVLIMHGDEDAVVPSAQGHALFAAASKPKAALWIPGHGHNDLNMRQLVDTLISFLTTAGAIKDAAAK